MTTLEVSLLCVVSFVAGFIFAAYCDVQSENNKK